MILKKPNLWLPSRRALLTGAAACAAYAALDGPALAVIGTPTTLGSGEDYLGGGASFAITTTAQITAGNLVVVLVGIFNVSNTSITVASISDGTNSYSKAISLGLSNAFTGNWQDFELWYVANAAQVSTSASLTITYSAADASTYGFAVSAQVSGIATASAYDAAGNTASGTSSSPSVTTGTLAQAAEIIFGCDFNNGGVAYTEDASFTNLYNNSNFALSLGYKIVAATTAVTHNPSLSSSNSWMELAAPFKGAGAAAATPKRTLLGVGQ